MFATSCEGPSQTVVVLHPPLHLQRYWDLLALICRPDLCVRMLNEDMSATPTAAPPAGSPPPTSEATWPAAALAAAALPAAQRASLAGAWRQHCEAAAQRAQHRQELLAQIREGFLQVRVLLSIWLWLNWVPCMLSMPLLQIGKRRNLAR